MGLILRLLYIYINRPEKLRKWEAMTGICDRCGAASWIYKMSKFNTDELCSKCQKDEKLAPGYAKADAAERAALKAQDYNFEGIGLSAADHYFLTMCMRQRCEG